MSKLLKRFDADFAGARDEAARGEALARKAGYLARVGSFDEAQSLIAQIRERFGDGRSTRVSIWTMLAEGLLHTYRSMSDQGADRIMRATALAGATRDRELIAATSAWRAHTQSERSEFAGMVRSLDDAFANSDSTNHEVLARLYMTLGNARMSIGDRQAAQDLYMYSRHHALECGDQATIDALIYNRAAFALAWLRARACFGETGNEQLKLLRLELASSKTYQQLIGVSALTNFVYLWQARLLLLTGEFENAIAALLEVRGMQPFAHYNYSVSLIDLEIGYCYLALGRSSEALEQTRDAVNAGLDNLHDDDRLVAAWIRTKLFDALPKLGDSAQAAVTLDQLRMEFNSSCAVLRKALEQLGQHAHIVRPTVNHPKSAL